MSPCSPHFRSLAAARHRARGALTLIELLVTMTVMVVIMGLALEIMIESVRATRKITRYQSALQYCQLALQQACASVGTAIAPANLAGLKDPALLTPRFEKKTMRFLAYEPGLRPYLCQVTLGLSDVKGEPAMIQRESRPIAETAALGQAVKERVEPLGGSRPEDFEASIRFEYAGAAEPGQLPKYQDLWTTNTWPALVRITVRGRLDRDREHPIELQTAAIPGLLPAMLPAATTTSATLAVKNPEPVVPIKAPEAPVKTTVGQAVAPTATPLPVVATPTITPIVTPTVTPTITPAGTPTVTPTPTALPVKGPDGPIKITRSRHAAHIRHNKQMSLALVAGSVTGEVQT